MIVIGLAVATVVQLADRVHRWRWLTGERRAELILLLDDLRSDVEALEARVETVEVERV